MEVKIRPEVRIESGIIHTHPHNLMKSSIGDVHVAFAIQSQAVRHVEQVLASGADHVTGVWIKDQDGVLLNHLAVGQGPVCIEWPREDLNNRWWFVMPSNRVLFRLDAICCIKVMGLRQSRKFKTFLQCSNTSIHHKLQCITASLRQSLSYALQAFCCLRLNKCMVAWAKVLV